MAANQPKPQTEQHEDDHIVQRVDSKKLAKHLYNRHSNDVFAYMNLTFSTFAMYLMGSSIRTPTHLNWPLGWTTSEFGQIYLVLQALNLYRVFKYHPRIFQNWFGRLVLLINGWSASYVAKSIYMGFNARAEFSKALLDQGIQPRAGKASSGYANLLSLIPLFLISRRGKPLNFRYDVRYAELPTIDPQLMDRWKRTPTKLRNLNQFLLFRGRMSEWLSLDVVSLGGLEGAPVYMHFHGGGWCFGDKKSGPHALNQRIASRGIVVCIVNYRLSPEVAWPNHILDCKRALIYVKQHCASWGGDPRKVFVGGESAGGHLSSFIGVTPNVPAYQPPEYPDADTSVAGTIPIQGVHDFTDQFGMYKASSTKILDMNFGMRGIASRIVLQTKFTPESKQLFELASPIYHLKKLIEGNVRPTIAPFLIPHGTADVLVMYEDSAHLFETLQKLRAKWGTWAEGEGDVLATIEGGLHAFGYWPSQRAHAMGDAITDFIFHHSKRIDIATHQTVHIAKLD